jgi:hypothetical protein
MKGHNSAKHNETQTESETMSQSSSNDAEEKCPENLQRTERWVHLFGKAGVD